MPRIDISEVSSVALVGEYMLELHSECADISGALIAFDSNYRPR